MGDRVLLIDCHPAHSRAVKAHLGQHGVITAIPHPHGKPEYCVKFPKKFGFVWVNKRWLELEGSNDE